MSLSKFQIATFSFGCFSIGAGCGYIYHKSCFNFFKRTQLLWPFIFNCIGITSVDTHKKLIKVIENDEQFSKIITRFKKDLDKISVLGLDCEWTSTKSKTFPVALLQLATFSGLCLLIRLNLLENSFPIFLKNILEDKDILKVGVGIIEDAQKLYRDYGFIVNGCVDLRFIAEKDDQNKFTSNSLKSLAFDYMHLTMNKSVALRCSDWNSPTLSKAQTEYAADDAFIALLVFFKIICGNLQFDQSTEYSIQTVLLKGFNHVVRFYCKDILDIKYKYKPQKKHSSMKKQRKPLISKSLKSYSARKAALYDNCKLQAPDGELLTTCDKKKALWYINKELADLVCEEPYTVRLRFEPAGRSISEDDSYYLIDKENICVVCGCPGPIVRKNVVPQEYRKHFPLKMKDHSSHDVVPLCVPCHRKSGFFDCFMRKELADTYQAPLGSVQAVQVLEDPHRRSVRSAGRALLGAGCKLPEERRNELESVLMEYYQVDHVTSCLLNQASTLETRFKNEAYVPHGQKVISNVFDLENIQGLINFESKWRRHFLEKMQPQYMPTGWSVSHNHEKILKLINS